MATRLRAGVSDACQITGARVGADQRWRALACARVRARGSGGALGPGGDPTRPHRYDRRAGWAARRPRVRARTWALGAAGVGPIERCGRLTEEAAHDCQAPGALHSFKAVVAWTTILGPLRHAALAYKAASKTNEPSNGSGGGGRRQAPGILDFVPDGRRGALFGLTITNPGGARTAKLTVDTHSELMGQYPWGFSGVTPNASDNIADKGSYDGRRLIFTDDGALPGAPTHHYAAAVGTALRPTSGSIGQQFWGPQPGHRCTGTETGAPADPKPSECDDGPFGKGTGGQLTYSLSLPAGGSKTVWLGVAGSDEGRGKAQGELAKLLSNPSRALAEKVASRQELAGMTRLSLPGDPLVENAIKWGKQNIADLTLQARDLEIRWTDQGKQFPAPSGTVDRRPGSVRAIRTTRGSSAPTRNTRRSPRSRSASSTRSRGICAHCGRSPTSSTTGPVW